MNKGLIFLLIIILVACLLVQEDKDYPVLSLPPTTPPKRTNQLIKPSEDICPLKLPDLANRKPDQNETLLRQPSKEEWEKRKKKK